MMRPLFFTEVAFYVRCTLSKKEGGMFMENEREEVIAMIEQALQGLQFGEVHIIIHEGQIVQVHRTEKFKIPK